MLPVSGSWSYQLEVQPPRQCHSAKGTALKRRWKIINLTYFFYPILILLPVLSFGRFSWKAADMSLWGMQPRGFSPSIMKKKEEKAKNAFKRKKQMASTLQILDITKPFNIATLAGK